MITALAIVGAIALIVVAVIVVAVAIAWRSSLLDHVPGIFKGPR